MIIFKTFTEAETAATTYFKKTFGHTKGVGIESAYLNQVEFYSKQDAAMDDTYSCIINDGTLRKCINGGEVVTATINL